GPQGLALVLVAGLVGVDYLLLGQHLQQRVVGELKADADFGDQLGQVPTADFEPDHVADKLANGGEGTVTGAFEIGNQRGQAGTDQSGLAHLGVDGCV